MADQVDEPLIAHSHESRQDDDQEDHLEGDLRGPGLFVWLLTFSAGISGLLFGCEY
jgi:MFS transporter, SP family, solute carrier family 2 (myo-inositol transporter), member 13